MHKLLSEQSQNNFVIVNRENKSIIKTDSISDVLIYIRDLIGYNSIRIEGDTIVIEKSLGIDLIYSNKPIEDLFKIIEEHLISCL